MNNLASHIYPQLRKKNMIVTLSSLTGGGSCKSTFMHAHMQLNMHVHTQRLTKSMELINFLTHLQKIISKTERICSCKCDEKLLNVEISEAKGK